MFKATVNVTLRKSILDPKGKATQHALQDLGLTGIQSTRIGKFIELEVEAASKDEAEQMVRTACEKVLANPVMEDFSIHIESAG
jgi:phosphoribosylformylglycinamidine synthase